MQIDAPTACSRRGCTTTSAGFTVQPVGAVAPGSVIVSPAPDEQLELGKQVDVWGRAWAATGVESVEVSVDAGQTWQLAMVEPLQQWSWQTFRFSWRHRFVWKRLSIASALVYEPDGSDAHPLFQLRPGAYNDETLIEFLTDLDLLEQHRSVVLL